MGSYEKERAAGDAARCCAHINVAIRILRTVETELSDFCFRRADPPQMAESSSI
jgi:hypothetical protein